jgi:hypothetical protein
VKNAVNENKSYADAQKEIKLPKYEAWPNYIRTREEEGLSFCPGSSDVFASYRRRDQAPAK